LRGVDMPFWGVAPISEQNQGDNVSTGMALSFPESLWHPMDSRLKDYAMRTGFTRKPQEDEPATQGKNYITPSGLRRLKDEHRFLLTRERPAVTKMVAWAAANGDRSENADYQYGKRRLRQIDGRIRFLTKRIEAAEEVNPESPRAGQAAARAFFGATVRYTNAAGTERTVSIVGADEVDLNRNHISWVSPLGRALLKSAAGDSVVLQAPGGTECLEVLEVCYERISVEPFREPPGSESSSKGPSRRAIATDEG
jgi:transcription elongation factor GreB